MTPESTAYDVLGVATTASGSELKRAYRRKLRMAHPDLGGSSERFRLVQWAWELVGTPEQRAAYDEKLRAEALRNAPPTRPRAQDAPPSRAAPRSRSFTGSGPPQPTPARTFGHPGGMRREEYMTAIRQWLGLGAPVDDYFDPDLVKRAPEPIRRILNKAIAEETTVRLVSPMGSTVTIFSGVRMTGGRQPAIIDHLILAPTGLYVVLSAEWSGPVQLQGGEVSGEGVARGSHPVRQLDRAAKWVAHGPGVRVAANLIVVRDDALEAPVMLTRRRLKPSIALVRRSALVDLLLDGVPGEVQLDAEELFEVRDVLQQALHYA